MKDIILCFVGTVIFMAFATVTRKSDMYSTSIVRVKTERIRVHKPIKVKEPVFNPVICEQIVEMDGLNPIT